LHDRLLCVIKLRNASETKIDQFHMSSRNDAKGGKVMTIASIRDISIYSPLIVCAEGLRLKAKLSTLITLTPHCLKNTNK
jgi:hypothetical protein